MSDPIHPIYVRTSTGWQQLVHQGPPGPAGEGGGTVILNGVGPPADAIGEAGDYYVDEVGDVMYGPKATEGWGVPQYGLPTETPTDTTPAGGYELGNRYDFHQPVQIIGLRFWRGASSSVLTRKLRLWSSAGVLVAETVNTVESAGVGGYIEALFPTPVIAVDEARYTCSYTEPGGQFQWNVVTPSNPNVAAITFVDGVYGTTLGAFPPNSQGASINRFCDPIYREPSTDVWPVAVGAGGGSGATEVWEGPEEPSPLADYRIWIDSDEPPAPPPTGDLNFVYNQLSPATSWSVAHNLGKFPSVEVVDSGGSVVIPDVLYVDDNNVTLSFGSITSGKAYFN